MGGGGGSDAKKFDCPTGTYFDRIKVRGGAQVDSVELWCKGGHGSGRVGGDGGDKEKDMWCDGFNKIEYWGGKYVDSMRLTCADKDSGWVGGIGGGARDPKTCPAGQVITSLGTAVLDGRLTGDITHACNYKIDCNNKNNLFRDECKEFKNNDSTRYNQLMKEYCNENDTNAKSEGCREWCRSNSTSCIRLNTLDDCTKYKISDSQCNIQKVGEVQALCKRYNIEQDLGTRSGWACSEDGVQKFKEECKTYNISEEVCDPTLLADTKANELNKQLAKQSIEVSQEQFGYTQNALSSVLGMTDYTPPPTTKPPSSTKEESDDNTMMIIIIVIVILLLLSSSSSGLFFIMNK